MFLELTDWLVQLHSGFGVLRYLTLRAIFAMLTALAISLFVGRYFIHLLRRRQIGQKIRKDGPETHLKKTGTPTMGGIIILLAFTISVLLWNRWTNIYIWIVLATALSFGAIGFLDDYLKIRRADGSGLKARQKYTLQSIAAAGLIAWIIQASDPAVATGLLIPFVKDWVLPIGVTGFFVLGYFVIIGSSNAVNLTDGLDGLAIMPVVLIGGTLGVFAYLSGHYNFADYLNMPFMPGAGEIFVLASALVGANLGFLWFNTYPSDIFMGDVGSLALGAILGVMAILVRQEILLFVMGGVFVAETISVILQVGAYKLKKKRIFLMAPLHHHFEKKGWSEPKIIVRFWMITFMLVLISLASIKIR